MTADYVPLTLEVATVTGAEKARAKAAREFVHDTVCPSPHGPAPCAACPSPAGLVLALRVLDASSRDVAGARRALHDVACMSGCGPESDHAARTQSKSAAALRKFVTAPSTAAPVLFGGASEQGVAS